MRFLIGCAVLAIVGCDHAPVPAPQAETVHTSRKVTYTSSLSGLVVWQGAPPHVEPIRAYRKDAAGAFVPMNRPAVNAPAIDAAGGVGGAVVYLRNVNADSVPGWEDHPPVTIEVHTDQPLIRQGDGPPTNIGFVRRGDAVTVISRQKLFHSLRARGSDFWALALPDPDQPRTRRLNQTGVIELSSGVNYFWMQGYIWVCDHPYFARTDAAGRWTLLQIPPGEYELVAWLPNWQLDRRERDPETGGIARYILRPPLQVMRPIVVRENEATIVEDLPINP